MDMAENFGYGNGYDKSWIFRIYIHILYPKMQLDIYPTNISGLWKISWIYMFIQSI